MELVEVLADVAADITVKILVEILAKVFVELTSEMELARTEPEAQVKIRQLKAWVEIQQLKELEVLLVAVYY